MPELTPRLISSYNLAKPKSDIFGKKKKQKVSFSHTKQCLIFTAQRANKIQNLVQHDNRPKSQTIATTQLIKKYNLLSNILKKSTSQSIEALITCYYISHKFE